MATAVLSNETTDYLTSAAAELSKSLSLNETQQSQVELALFKAAGKGKGETDD
ncbi:MAG: hypothetical protein AABZ23_00705 [Deltaproteobacteria bacterium]